MNNIIIKQGDEVILELAKQNAHTRCEFLKRGMNDSVQERCNIEIPLQKQELLKPLEQMVQDNPLTIELVNPVEGTSAAFTAEEVHEYRISHTVDGTSLQESITFIGTYSGIIN